ncbi:MAG: hypothetical protein A2030_00580 [Chloroflexi bacterium RBG_19FT_COMBO_50_10]|nr:MAG: hypothetical protein A2030_00580 [Chloroflexi bacterium RBG_19FT_COMBO_50_10]
MWFNTITIWLLHSPLHGMFSGNTMVVSFTGRKSGKTYRVPVGYLRVGVTLLTVSFKRRTWWRNLRGGAPVTLRLQGKDVTAQAEVVEDEQGVVEGLKDFIGENPQARRIFGVRLGADGQLESESLQRAARDRVIVHTTMK